MLSKGDLTLKRLQSGIGSSNIGQVIGFRRDYLLTTTDYSYWSKPCMLLPQLKYTHDVTIVFSAGTLSAIN